LTENKLASTILDISFEIHKTLGPGLFESVYEEIICYELSRSGIEFKRQEVIPVTWKRRKMNIGFKADIILENRMIVEIKSVEQLAPVHHKQLLTYLRLTDIKLGLLINFNEALLKNGIKRIANNL
jgi:GxxExxY protein